MLDLPTSLKNRGLNRRHLTGLSLLLLCCFLFFNVKYLNGSNSIDESHSIATGSSSITEKNLKYLIVIGTEAKYESRRKLIRSSYFGIHDNLVPAKLENVEYTFLTHGGPPSSNTPERRLFETEKMEYNDISQLSTGTIYSLDSVIRWVYDNHLRNKDTTFDYLIVQDIHSFIHLDRLLEEKHDSTLAQQWGKTPEGIVMSVVQVEQLFHNKDSAQAIELASQVWQNSIESTDTDNVLVTNVYQDQDFIDLVSAYQLKPVRHSSNEKASVVVVTSSYIYDRCMEPSGTKASLNKRDYADKHGYAFVARSREFAQQAIRPDQRRTVWGKIDAIQKVLPKYDWLFWLDMDAVVMNSEQSVEALLEHVKSNYYEGTQFDQDIDFIIVRPGSDKMINAGVFLIRNTAWSLQFLQQVQKREEWYRQGPSYEQGAMWDVMQQEENKKHTLFLDRKDHIFNTFPKYYELGDFIVHFAPDKCPNAATLKGLAAADKIRQGKTVTAAELE